MHCKSKFQVVNNYFLIFINLCDFIKSYLFCFQGGGKRKNDDRGDRGNTCSNSCQYIMLPQYFKTAF